MKAIRKITAAACLISICLIGSQAVAGNLYGTGGCVDIWSAEKITVSSIVSEAKLDTDQGINTVYIARSDKSRGRGPGDGTGNGGNGPKDGSGNGNKTGDCPFGA